ncbi:MAG TPA: DUF6670 family protein [Moraxellaceae bacterium]
MTQAFPLWTWLDRSHAINGDAVQAPLTLRPHIPNHAVHFGIMLPGLPEPFRFLNLITVIGQPRARIFRNTHLIRTTAADTASLLVGTATATPDHFRGYSVQQDCEFAADGSRLRFGNELLMEGRYPVFTARRQGHDFNFELQLRATDRIAHFAKMVGGLYDHWSILCEYQGHLEQGGVQTPVQGLCTYEYARAANLPLPLRFFSYQIINVDARTQVLFVVVLGPRGLPVQRRVYVRSLDSHGGIYSRGFDFTVHEYEASPVTSPEGATMRLPRRFSWQVQDDQGKELIVIDGECNGDFRYGMAAGYAGSYRYQGRFRGQPLQGTGYIEYIDYR